MPVTDPQKMRAVTKPPGSLRFRVRRIHRRPKGGKTVTDDRQPRVHERWAHLRFSIVGPLLAAPPGSGELQAELKKLAGKTWLHPVTGEPVRFGVSTMKMVLPGETNRTDPVGPPQEDPGGRAGSWLWVRPDPSFSLSTPTSGGCQLHYDN
jgi:hypothetical protein